jgi:citrate synthase
MFPVLFALGRLPGWYTQWRENLTDGEQKLSRPRQLYVGPQRRDYVPFDAR